MIGFKKLSIITKALIEKKMIVVKGSGYIFIRLPPIIRTTDNS